MNQPLEQRLTKGAAALGVEVTRSHAESIFKYLKLLIKWNKRINLTGARNETDLVELHVLDSIALVPHIPLSATRIVDVGSGAGFASVMAALFRPSLSATALEPSHKKHAFLSAVKRELPLPNLHPLAQRMEDHLSAGAREPYDLAVSRATWPLPDWLQRGARLVRPGGVILGFEGASTYALPAGALRHEYALASRRRALVVVQTSIPPA